MYTYMHLNICDNKNNDENKKVNLSVCQRINKKKPVFHCFIQSISFEAAICYDCYCVCLYLLTMWFGEWNGKCMCVFSFLCLWIY